MNTKHTKGPWKVADGGSWVVADCEPFLRIAIVEPDHRSMGNVEAKSEWPEAEANARLIAAAPDQHEAHSINLGDLEMLAKAIEAGDPKAELTMRVSDLVIRTRAAIAKAIS